MLKSTSINHNSLFNRVTGVKNVQTHDWSNRHGINDTINRM